MHSPFDKVMSNTHRPISIQFRTNVTPLQTVAENERSHSMKTVSFSGSLSQMSYLMQN